ncbi:MAG: zinc ribbon domain-containing protein [bacterium]|nr:zinc ribbon domain-containing protein [bacterium]
MNETSGKAHTLKHWTLGDDELAATTGRAQLTPWQGSPWQELVPSSRSSAPPPDDPQLLAALDRIARPDTVLGVLRQPPATAAVGWLYGRGGDDHFALHLRDAKQQHEILYPIGGQQVITTLLSRLDLEAGGSIYDFALSLDADGLAALAAVIDLQREQALRTAIERTAVDEVTFDPETLTGVVERSRRGEDFRWMIPRAQLFAPEELELSARHLAAGLEQLVDRKMLDNHHGRLRLTESFAWMCTLIGTPAGWSVLSVRRRRILDDGAHTWRRQQVAVIRGVDSLWLFDFNPIEKGGFRVHLGDVSPAMLIERLRGMVASPAVETRPTPEDRAPVVTGENCPHCDVTLRPRPGQQYCPECGKRIVCSECGRKLRPEAGFCTGCGWEIVW